MRQANVGPSEAPLIGVSARPMTNKSTSSTDLHNENTFYRTTSYLTHSYIPNMRSMISDELDMSRISAHVVGRDKPHCSRQNVYDGMP
jgi:hypothetical protein